MNDIFDWFQTQFSSIWNSIQLWLESFQWFSWAGIIIIALVVSFIIWLVRFMISQPILAVLGLHELLGPARDFIKPPKWDSWQTLIWISLFSWIVSLLASPALQSFIASCGWLFLIPGVHWAMHTSGLRKILTIGQIFLGPWITGALVCIYLFVTPDNVPRIAWIVWPLISAAIAVLPRFIKSGSELQWPKVGVRLDVMILLLSNVLLSCWIQLCFATQDWLENYPTFLAEDMSSSSFVIRLASGEPPSRGTRILQEAESTLKAELSQMPWSEVERWLLNWQQQLPRLEANTLAQLPAAAENSLWRLTGRILPGGQGQYRLQLVTSWQGPTSTTLGSYFAKTCEITKSDRKALLSPGQIDRSRPGVEVRCGEVEGPISGKPPGL